MSWFGHLPGDIRLVGERSSVYFPITSIVVLTLALWLVRRLGTAIEKHDGAT